MTRKNKSEIGLPRPDFGPIGIRQEGSQWVVTWELSFTAPNALEATKLLAQLVGVEQAAHGDWEAHVVLTQERAVAETAAT